MQKPEYLRLGSVIREAAYAGYQKLTVEGGMRLLPQIQSDQERLQSHRVAMLKSGFYFQTHAITPYRCDSHDAAVSAVKGAGIPGVRSS